MSWRDVARAAVAREESGAAMEAGASDATACDMHDEREAIAIVDGGLPPEWASSLTALEREPRPAGIAERDWRAALDKVWARADLHGAEFMANGWTFEEVFGVGAHWLRLDRRGGGWLGLDARIVEITPQRIVFERGRERMTHHKQGRPH